MFIGPRLSHHSSEDTLPRGDEAQATRLKSPPLERPPRQDHAVSVETCRLGNGREVEVRGTLHGDGKIFLAPLDEGGPQVPMEVIGQGGRDGRVYGEIGKWKDCLVENKRGRGMRGVWEKLYGTPTCDGQFKTAEGVFNKTGAGYIRGLSGSGPHPAATAEQIASIDAAVAAWVAEAPGDFERVEREEAAAERSRCLAGKEEFKLNSILTIQKYPDGFFVGMDKLRTLDLAFNTGLTSLEGSGYERLGELRTLILDECALRSVTVGQLKNLEVLRAKECRSFELNDDGLRPFVKIEGIDKLSALQTFIATIENFEDVLQLSSLKTLMSPWEEINSFKALEHLHNLEHVNINSDSLEGIGHFKKLKTLTSSAFEEDEERPLTLHDIAKCTALEKVVLGTYRGISLTGLEELTNLKSVELRLCLDDDQDQEEEFIANNNDIIKALKKNGVLLELDSSDEPIDPLSLDKEFEIYKRHVQEQLGRLQAGQSDMHEATVSSLRFLTRESRDQETKIRQLDDKLTAVGEKTSRQLADLEAATSAPVELYNKAAAAQKIIHEQMVLIKQDPLKKADFEDMYVALHGTLTRALGFQPQLEGMAQPAVKGKGVTSFSAASSGSALASSLVESASSAASAVLSTDPVTKVFQSVLDIYNERDFNIKNRQLSHMLGERLEDMVECCHTLARALTLMKVPDPAALPGSVGKSSEHSSVWKKIKKNFEEKLTHQMKRMDGTAEIDMKRTMRTLKTFVHASQALLGISSGKAFGHESHEVGMHFSLEEKLEKGLEWFCKEQNPGEFRFSRDLIVWGLPDKDFKPKKTSSTQSSQQPFSSSAAAAQSAQPLLPSSMALLTQLVEKFETQAEINHKQALEMKELRDQLDRQAQINQEQAKEIALLRGSQADLKREVDDLKTEVHALRNAGQDRAGPSAINDKK